MQHWITPSNRCYIGLKHTMEKWNSLSTNADQTLLASLLSCLSIGRRSVDEDKTEWVGFDNLRKKDFEEELWIFS